MIEISPIRILYVHRQPYKKGVRTTKRLEIDFSKKHYFVWIQQIINDAHTFLCQEDLHRCVVTNTFTSNAVNFPAFGGMFHIPVTSVLCQTLSM